MRTPGIRAVFSLMILLAGLSATISSAQADKLIEFRLSDQFDNEYVRQDFDNSVLVLVGGNRGGSLYSNDWGIAIKKKLLADGVKFPYTVAGVADLRGVPDMFKQYVKSRFPEEKDRWILMDWEGLFAVKYGFVEDVANILIFTSEGDLVYRQTAREVTTAGLNKIVSFVESLE